MGLIDPENAREAGEWVRERDERDSGSLRRTCPPPPLALQVEKGTWGLLELGIMMPGSVPGPQQVGTANSLDKRGEQGDGGLPELLDRSTSCSHHGEWSQCFIITVSGVSPLKITNHYIVRL